MTAPTAQPVQLFEAVDPPSTLEQPSAGLIPSLGSRQLGDHLSGGAWLPDALGQYQLVNPCDPDPPEFPSDGPRRKLVLVSPITLRTSYWWQGRPQDFDQDAAERYASVVTSAAVARELWEGEGTRAEPYALPQSYGGATGQVNDYLANPDTCWVAEGTGLAPADAIAALDGLGQRALKGATTPVIHVTPEVAQAGAEKLTRYGSTMRTINGSVVVADAGATGKGPGSRTGLWGYVTGPVGVWLGPVSSDSALEDTTQVQLNRRQVWAHRSFMVGFDPACHIAVPIDYALPALTAPTGG